MPGAVTLIIYAYSSLVASWGPGPILSTEFQKTCKCIVKFIDTGDGKDVIGRLKLEGPDTPADIILGLDSSSVDILKRDLHWDVTSQGFDYSPYAFVYDSTIVKMPPKNLDELLDEKWKGQILLEDPRLSTTGLGFLLWVVSEKGERGAWDYFRKLKPQIKITSPSWDLAYGLFKKGQGQLVFSYWTSPAYHIQEENNFNFKAARFDHGNYIQKEYLLLNPNSKHQQLKKDFLKFMLSDFAQQELVKHNFMYPVEPKTPLSPAFQKIGTVKSLPEISPKPKQIEQWLKKWQEIFS